PFALRRPALTPALMGRRPLTRMNATALPVVRSKPFLEVVEPDQRPLHEGPVDPHRGVPFAGTGEIEAQAKPILVHVGNLPAAGKRADVRHLHEDTRNIAAAVFDPQEILAAEGRGPARVLPRQASRIHLACAMPHTACAQEHILLRRRQMWTFPPGRHQSPKWVLPGTGKAVAEAVRVRPTVGAMKSLLAARAALMASVRLSMTRRTAAPPRLFSRFTVMRSIPWRSASTS